MANSAEQRTFFGFGRPANMLREELLADPEAQAIAKMFGITIDAYADLVLEFALNPEKEPELELIDDEDFEECEVRVPDEATITMWVEAVEASVPPAPSETIADPLSLRLIAGGLPLRAPESGSERGQIKGAEVLRGQILAGRRIGRP